MRLLIINSKATLRPINQTLNTNGTTHLTFINLKAATILVLFLVFGININGQPKEYTNNDGIKPGKRKAVLILSDGRTIELSASDSLNHSQQNKFITKADTIKAHSLPDITTKCLQTPHPNTITYKNSLKRE
jgi:hypothetical protein